MQWPNRWDVSKKSLKLPYARSLYLLRRKVIFSVWWSFLFFLIFNVDPYSWAIKSTQHYIQITDYINYVKKNEFQFTRPLPNITWNITKCDASKLESYTIIAKSPTNITILFWRQAITNLDSMQFQIYFIPNK